ncbi:MAG: tetratricopeptide repeat protein, partial [Chitinophagaceae bacterium]
AFNSIGANYWAKNDFLTAQSFFMKALKINEAINDKKGMAKGFHSMATIYVSLYNYTKALDFYAKALRINEEMRDTSSIYGCLANIGNVYETLKRYNQAMSYYTKSLEMAEKSGDKGGIAYRLGSIGFIHAKQNNFSEALRFQNLALKITTEIGIKNDIAKRIGDIGQIYLLMGNYDLALKYIQDALNLFNKVPTNGAKGYTGRYLGLKGKVYLAMATSTDARTKINQQPDNLNQKLYLNKAVQYFKLAIPLLKSINDHDALQNTYYGLSEAQNKIGNFHESLNNYKYHILYKDSVNNLERDKEITRNELE